MSIRVDFILLNKHICIFQIMSDILGCRGNKDLLMGKRKLSAMRADGQRAMNNDSYFLDFSK